MPDTQEYKTTTIEKKVGKCGNLYVIFMEDDDAFHKIYIKGDLGKMPCGGCWLDAMARILTYSLRRGIWEGTAGEGIVHQLLHIRCNDIAANAEHISSCCDAIGRAVKEYLKLEEPQITLQKTP